jgi:hypothetical protein
LFHAVFGISRKFPAKFAAKNKKKFTANHCLVDEAFKDLSCEQSLVTSITMIPNIVKKKNIDYLLLFGNRFPTVFF